MRRFYISNIGWDTFRNMHRGYHVRDRSYPTSANVMCTAVEEKNSIAQQAQANIKTIGCARERCAKL